MITIDQNRDFFWSFFVIKAEYSELGLQKRRSKIIITNLIEWVLLVGNLVEDF